MRGLASDDGCWQTSGAGVVLRVLGVVTRRVAYRVKMTAGAGACQQVTPGQRTLEIATPSTYLPVQCCCVLLEGGSTVKTPATSRRRQLELGRSCCFAPARGGVGPADVVLSPAQHATPSGCAHHSRPHALRRMRAQPLLRGPELLNGGGSVRRPQGHLRLAAIRCRNERRESDDSRLLAAPAMQNEHLTAVGSEGQHCTEEDRRAAA